MPFPNQDYSKRDFLLPQGCKDLADAIKHKNTSAISPVFYRPMIKREVTLPEKVLVPCLKELTGASLYSISLFIQELKIGTGGGVHLVDFDDAARFLEKYGIIAKREKPKSV